MAHHRVDAGPVRWNFAVSQPSVTVVRGPRNPPYQRVLDAANWGRLIEWGLEKAQGLADLIGSMGLFRQRSGVRSSVGSKRRMIGLSGVRTYDRDRPPGRSLAEFPGSKRGTMCPIMYETP